MKNFILSLIMVGITTSMFSQLQMVNDSIYSSGNLICVIHPIDKVITSEFNMNDKTKKSISVLARTEYPKTKFEFFTYVDSPELTPKESRKVRKEIRNYPLFEVGKNLADGATLIFVSPTIGVMVSLAFVPWVGGAIALYGTVTGYVKIIKAGKGLQLYEVQSVN